MVSIHRQQPRTNVHWVRRQLFSRLLLARKRAKAETTKKAKWTEQVPCAEIFEFINCNQSGWSWRGNVASKLTNKIKHGDGSLMGSGVLIAWFPKIKNTVKNYHISKLFHRPVNGDRDHSFRKRLRKEPIFLLSMFRITREPPKRRLLDEWYTRFHVLKWAHLRRYEWLWNRPYPANTTVDSGLEDSRPMKILERCSFGSCCCYSPWTVRFKITCDFGYQSRLCILAIVPISVILYSQSYEFRARICSLHYP